MYLFLPLVILCTYNEAITKARLVMHVLFFSGSSVRFLPSDIIHYQVDQRGKSCAPLRAAPPPQRRGAAAARSRGGEELMHVFYNNLLIVVNNSSLRG